MKTKQAATSRHWHFTATRAPSESKLQHPVTQSSVTDEVLRQCAADCANATDTKAALSSWFDGFFDYEANEPHRSDFKDIEELDLRYYTKGWGFSYAYNERPVLTVGEYESMEAYDV